MASVVGVVAAGAGCSRSVGPDRLETSPDLDASDFSDAGHFAPPVVPSCYPECPEPSPCGGGNFGGCPEGLVSENGCCDTCAQSTGVTGSFAVDDAGRCTAGSIAEGRCCAVCSNIGPGAVPMGDAEACPGDLVQMALGCCAPCSALIEGPIVAVARPTDSGTCPDGFDPYGASWSGAMHAIECCVQLQSSRADSSLDAGGIDAGADGG